MTPAPVVIRPATAGDQARLEALWSALMAEQGALDPRLTPAPDADARGRVTLRDLIRGGEGVVLVAEAAGTVVGFLTAEGFEDVPVYAAEAEVLLAELYVAPEARRRGVARALLEAGAAWARRRGAGRLRMGVLWSNEASRRLVEGWGALPLSVTYTRRP